ncbi:MAG: SDR family NAD(P)-dependent oxidoreductase [Sediminibacterium sp.]
MTLIIITGVSRGLGHSLVEILLQYKEKNISLIGLSRNVPQVAESQAFQWIQADLSDHKTITEKISLAVQDKKVEKLIFINNAADINPLGKVGGLKEEAIAPSIDINIVSPVIISNWLVSHFSSSKITFLNISSGAAQRSIIGWSQYCSAKAYMEMFYTVIAEEAKEDQRNVEVVNINPGVMNTMMQEEIRGSGIETEQHRRLTDLYNTGQLKDTRQVAQEIFENHIQKAL